MILDFFCSKEFPKFYLKTKKKELFATGKQEEKNQIKVGFVPIDHHPNLQSGFYYPKHYELKELEPQKSLFPLFTQKPKTIKHNYSFSTFCHSIETVKNAIKNGEISKAVLKRDTTFIFNQKIDPKTFFLDFQQKNPHVHHFFIQPDEKTIFFGGTPEHLFSREQQSFETMALASTISSKQNEKHLLNNEKMLHEFLIVQKQIASILEDQCANVTVSRTEIKNFGPLSHLHSTIRALSSSSQDEPLLRLLHPTAAIIGFPKEKALHLVKEIEKKPRSFYASALGYLSDSQSEIVVGIRSALIEENLLHAFAGVGIVKESIPRDEWKELNLKLKPMKIWMDL
jgi:menaquinone-specific isochorismate synthase